MPYDFRELWLSMIPITSSRVSYGFPVIDSMVSFGLSKPNSVTVRA